MRATTFRTHIFGLVLPLALVMVSIADEQPSVASAAATTETKNPAAALFLMQKAQANGADAFVVQGTLDSLIREGGGGACASAAGIDVLQAARLMAGLDLLDNPHKVVLSSFTDQPGLLDGRVTNAQLVRLFDFYQAHLNGDKLKVEIESAPNSEHKNSGRTWSALEGPDLRTESNQIKILSYTVTNPDGVTLGRHFVLLKEKTPEGLVVVVDPAKPAKDRRYVIEFAEGDDGDRERVFLLNPHDAPARASVFELNTVFSVSLTPKEAEQASNEPSVEVIKAGIDRTASELRGTDDFLSPRAWRKRTAGFGLPGLDLPLERGGGDWPATKMVEIFRHAGRHNLNFRDVVGGAHVRALRHSTNPKVQSIVEQVAKGAGYVAIAITEPEVGTDVRAIKSTSRKVKGGYSLSGHKRFNARLGQATHVIIFTQGTTGELGKLSVFVLPIDTPGLEIETLEAHGLTGNSYGGLRFKDVFVSDDYLIGEDGQGTTIFDEHFLYWRLMQAAAASVPEKRRLKSWRTESRRGMYSVALSVGSRTCNSRLASTRPSY